MAAGNPTINTVTYQDPWSPGIPDQTAAGLTFNAKFPSDSTYLLVGRLILDGIPFPATSSSLANTAVTIMPPCPLAKGGPCYGQAQFVQVQTGYNPAAVIAGIDWTDASTINIPILPSVLELSEGTVEISGTTLSATFSWANQLPITAYVQIYTPSEVETLTFVSCFNHSITLSCDYSASSYTVVLRPLIPLNSPPPTPWPPNALLTPSTPSVIGTGITYTLPTQAPEVTTVTYDGSTVSPTWPALTVPEDVEVFYELLLTCTSNGVSTTTAYPASPIGGTAPLPMPGSQETYTVSARVNYGVIKGPPAAPVTVVTGIVCNITQITDSGSGIATLQWGDPNTAPAGNTVTYNLAFSGGSPASVTGITTKSFKLPNALTADKFIEVSITRVVSTTSPATTSTGPSVSRKLAANQPTLLSAQYDGTTVSLVWAPVTTGEVLQYTATLTIGSSTTETHIAPGSATALAFQPTNSITYSDPLSVVLQATRRGDAGPGLPSAPMAIGLSQGFLLGTSTPYLYPIAGSSAWNTPPTAADIVLYLPNGNYLQSGKIFAVVTNDPFALAANTDANRANYPYTLTIASSTWTISSNSIRSDVQSAYITFLEAAERTGNFNPWGISVLQEAIARYMPQSYAEMLYYSYGMNVARSPNLAHVDLRPGMVLRVMPSDYLVVPGQDIDDQNIKYLDGYTNSAPIDYDIGSYSFNGGWSLGFDAFISQLVASGALAVSAPPTLESPSVGGIAEAADLYSPTFPNPFYRLFIPTTLLTPTGPGASQPQFQFNLASANSFINLQATTNPTTSNTNTYFRGRAIIKVCIRVTINGNESVVPIGTTLKNILERSCHVPPGNGVQLNGLMFERAMGQTDVTGGNSWQVGRYYPVRFDYRALNYTEGSALDIPLLHGDRISFGE